MIAKVLKMALPHLLAIAVFMIAALIYCRPVLEGKVLNQSDMLGWKGMARQSVEFKEKHGHYPLWTESVFSGMPAYNIIIGPTTRITAGISLLSRLLTLGLPKPMSFFFLACICFYFLTQTFRINPWIGILSSLAYAYSSFNPILVAAGHDSEILALGYAPAVIGGFLLILQQRYLLGASVLTLFFAFQMGTLHLQIVYYTGIIMGLLALFFLIDKGRGQSLQKLALSFGISAGCLAIGYGVYADSMMPIQEYAKETMRGGRTELSSGKTKLESQTGLSTDYAFGWSEGIGETLTILVPNIYGGTGGRQLGSDSRFVGKLTEAGMTEDNAIQEANGICYWGQQPYPSSTFYYGAFIGFLFVLGLVFTKGWIRGWLITTAVAGILLSWGKHFAILNDFLFDRLPYYNHFRAPTTALTLCQFALPLLAALGLNQVLISNEREAVWRKFKTSLYVLSGILLFLAGFYFMAQYKGPDDAQIRTGFSQQLVQGMSRGKEPTAEIEQQANSLSGSLMRALEEDRQSVYGTDLLRYLLWIAAAALLTGLFLKGKLNQKLYLIGLVLLSTYDLISVAYRYLNEDQYLEASDSEVGFSPSPADLQISKDPDQNFRVYDEIGGPSSEFQMSMESSRTSYYHNSVGGYSPAKLGLYQDLIDNQLSKGNLLVFNMLNTRYFIQEDPATRQPVARINTGANGPCWLVKRIHYVKDGNEEMKALDSIDTKDQVIIQRKYADRVHFDPVADSTASIRLVENLNDGIKYQFISRTPQFAVFSEIYYQRGWDVWMDGKPADYLRVNYLLRGMPVPAGNHIIEFRFEPRSYRMGNQIAIFSSLIVYLLLLGTLTRFLKTTWQKK
jgi:hypothetical protein